MPRLCANTVNLGLHEVSRDNDWISLGGNLLVATQLVPFARQEQVFPTVHDIFRHRTASALCQNMETDITEMVEGVSSFSLLSDYQLQSDEILPTIAE